MQRRPDAIDLEISRITSDDAYRVVDESVYLIG